MKCPACDRDLKSLQVGSVTVDVCERGCGGIWFDAFELKKVDEEHEAAGEHLTSIQRDPQVKVDAERKRQCPRCEGIKLQRHLFSRTSKVLVDHCPNCAGYWLDAGELAQIRAEQSPGRQAATSETFLTMETIRYMYRVRIQQRPSA